MRTAFPRRLALALALLATGCGGPRLQKTTSPPPVRPGPHGGQALLLGEAVGYIELANDPPVDPRSDEETSLTIFFLKPDAKTSLSPTPTNVAVRVWHENKYRKVKLQASPLPKDPAGGSRFITPPGPFSLVTVRGTVTAKIDGRLVSKEVGGAR